MVVISEYRQEWDETAAGCRIYSDEASVCPLCSGFLWRFGTRSRGIIQSCGEKLRLIIRRWKCKMCGKIHHELPDIMVPYKRHCAETVENIVADKTAEVCCEESTTRRIKAWWAGCLLYFESIIVSLRAKYGAVFSVHPAPREIVRALVNTNLWPSTRSAFLSG